MIQRFIWDFCDPTITAEIFGILLLHGDCRHPTYDVFSHSTVLLSLHFVRIICDLMTLLGVSLSCNF